MAQHNGNATTDDDYDDPYGGESVTVPGLGFNGLLVTIGHFLRKLFSRPTPSH